MVIFHTMEEEPDGNGGHGGDDLGLQVAMPADVQAVLNAAEKGDTQPLSTSLVLVFSLVQGLELSFNVLCVTTKSW